MSRLLPVAWIMWYDEIGRSRSMLMDENMYRWEALQRIISYDLRSPSGVGSPHEPLALRLLMSLRATALELRQL